MWTDASLFFFKNFKSDHCIFFLARLVTSRRRYVLLQFTWPNSLYKIWMETVVVTFCSVIVMRILVFSSYWCDNSHQLVHLPLLSPKQSPKQNTAFLPLKWVSNPTSVAIPTENRFTLNKITNSLLLYLKLKTINILGLERITHQWVRLWCTIHVIPTQLNHLHLPSTDQMESQRTSWRTRYLYYQSYD